MHKYNILVYSPGTPGHSILGSHGLTLATVEGTQNTVRLP